jgi:hypothetical protein
MKARWRYNPEYQIGKTALGFSASWTTLLALRVPVYCQL